MVVVLLLASCLGPLAIVAWNQMPVRWLCDYGEVETKMHEKGRLTVFPWAFLFALGFVGCAYRIFAGNGIFSVFWLDDSFSKNWEAAGQLVGLWVLLLIFLADQDFSIIPDQLIVSLALIGLSQAIDGMLWVRVLAGLACGGAFFLLGRFGGWLLACENPCVGFGDVKLLFALGILLGIEGGFTVLLGGTLLGGAWFTLLVITGRVGLFDERPFGPFLCLAAAVYLLL